MTTNVLPSEAALQHARASLLSQIPQSGHGDEATQRHLHNDLLPALNKSSQSPNYYGFVTGGSTPIAALADNLVTAHDQNVQVHLPNETAATNIEAAALRMLCDLVDLSPTEWRHKTFTTGATASTIIGLTCGREYVVREAARRIGIFNSGSVAEDGLFEAMTAAKIDRVQIVTSVPHSSLRKAAAVVGLGRKCFIDVGCDTASHRFDMPQLARALKTPRTASIVAVSCAEINTGLFATNADDMQSIRKLADEYGAWIHVDAAFGLPARLLASNVGYDALLEGVAGIQLADSITGDAHKLLNVPYDCGFLFSKDLALAQHCFQNPNAAYLASVVSQPTNAAEPSIPSPLNIGIENSRRFRALPVYASLMAYGKNGYVEMLVRQISLTRAIATYIDGHDAYELLPNDPSRTLEERLANVYIIVLFRAKGQALNGELVQRINGSKRIYVSGTQWEGRPAARFAVSNWQVDVERDIALVKKVMDDVANDARPASS
ncbi:hypothetical protein LTR95_000517 [Oleoguttula sp. CCFEE 5521]